MKYISAYPQVVKLEELTVPPCMNIPPSLSGCWTILHQPQHWIKFCFEHKSTLVCKLFLQINTSAGNSMLKVKGGVVSQGMYQL